FKRIGHAANVARYAEQIVREEQGNPAVVLCAAYLHDIGMHEAQRKHNNRAAKYHEEEGPIIAGKILTKLGAKAEIIEEVCNIIGHHHHATEEETLNFKVVYDADLIVNIEEGYEDRETQRDKVEGIIDKTFLTETGKRVAREALLGVEQ
ncbi:MAG: HD domain-containing protein, partial [Deltaproteobacteria bacterium]|nr:HD domain-containing protein [Deltaproteobacteria bacterium]